MQGPGPGQGPGPVQRPQAPPPPPSPPRVRGQGALRPRAGLRTQALPRQGARPREGAGEGSTLVALAQRGPRLHAAQTGGRLGATAHYRARGTPYKGAIGRCNTSLWFD